MKKSDHTGDWRDIKDACIGIFNSILGGLALWGSIYLAYLVFPGSFS